ncbi:MAG: DUF2971 domain-containing protein [Clostridia bacterium]|nr:DUF2971 domain-containing protein [Clostridia bacterium]
MQKMSFSEITRPCDLVDYLKDSQRFNSVKTLTKYMKLSSLHDMFYFGTLFINNPKNMNDLYEYRGFKPLSRWEKICFSSFIIQSDENMAMWSMYAQPWEEGVMVSIPMAPLKALLSEEAILISAEYDKDTSRYKPGNATIPSNGIVSLSRVAYFDGATITCTGRDDRNHNFRNPYTIPEFTGYIKDSAWAYEKEARLRVDLPETYNQSAIYLKLPDLLLKQIRITTGPRFAGSVLMSIPLKYRPQISISSSKFNEKIAWIPCDTCKYRKNMADGSNC